jgi:hypothetical protein
MHLDELSGPDLAGVISDANAVGLEYVVIGGFSVIYHGYIRATKDSDHYDTVAKRAETGNWGGEPVLIAALPSLVGFKRLANRPQDRLDLAELEAIYGKLPIESIPGIDT